MSAMTNGEKMVWAAAFALEFSRLRDAERHDQAKRASKFADAAVSALRFGAPADGAFFNAMVHE